MKSTKRKCKDVDDVVSEIDAKFADIQKYINNLDIVSKDCKENLIALCMVCNDNIVNAILTNDNEDYWSRYNLLGKVLTDVQATVAHNKVTENKIYVE